MKIIDTSREAYRAQSKECVYVDDLKARKFARQMNLRAKNKVRKYNVQTNV